MQRRAAARELSGMEASYSLKSRGGLRSSGLMANCLGGVGASGDGSWAAQRFSPLARCLAVKTDPLPRAPGLENLSLWQVQANIARPQSRLTGRITAASTLLCVLCLLCVSTRNRRTPSDSLPAAGVSQWFLVVRRFSASFGAGSGVLPVGRTRNGRDCTRT